MQNVISFNMNFVLSLEKPSVIELHYLLFCQLFDSINFKLDLQLIHSSRYKHMLGIAWSALSTLCHATDEGMSRGHVNESSADGFGLTRASVMPLVSKAR